MSGDVQPRKRKDKRRKKEVGSLGNIHEPISPHKFKRSESDDKKVFDVPDQGEKIHVQNEHGVGGNICVKIIFFCLFGLLVGAVGLIYMKSLGSTDVDLPTIEESRFAEYFTGWLDDNTDDHENEALENTMDLDEHGEQEDNEIEEDQNSVQDSLYKLFGLQIDEPDEVEENSMEVNKVIETEESGIRQDVDEDEDSAEEKDEEDEEEGKSNIENGENEEEDKSDMEDEEDEEEEDSNMKNAEDEEEENSDMEDEEDEGDIDNDSGIGLIEKNNDENEENEDLSQKDEEDNKYNTSELDGDEESERNEGINVGKEDEDDNDNELNKKFNAKKQDEDYDNNIEDINEDEEENKEKENFNSKIDDEDLGYEEIDISEEDLKVEIEDKMKASQDEDQFREDAMDKLLKGIQKDSKIEQVQSNSEGNEEETKETDIGGVAVKLGVGIALIIVAHLVLVKKWKSMRNAPSDENSAEIETAPEKKEIKNLQAASESLISRRQTLVPENTCFITEAENEGSEDDEEEEENIEYEEYSEEEVEEDEFKKSKNNGWETFEKPSWNIKKNENEGGDEELDNEEFEDDEEEEFEEEDVEQINDEREGEEEEDDDDDDAADDDDDDDDDYEEDVDDDEIDDKNDLVKQKLRIIDDEEKQGEAKTTPTPPPRTKNGRGAQKVDEDFFSHFEEANEVEETNQDSPKEKPLAADEISINSKLEDKRTFEQKTPEKKVGNEDEWAFRQDLDFADEQLENNPKAAVKIYDEIISKKPTIIRALIGRARALDHWAEKEKSNSYLNQAIKAYRTLLIDHGHLLEDEIYVKMAERCIERMRFAGALASAIDIHKALISKYPNIPKYRNTLAVTYLMLNKIPQARVLLKETLTLWPEDGFALVHYGFILKTSDNNMEEGAKMLMAGIQTKQEGVIDGMFFFHLGDALNRLGREKEAMKWYELGVKEGLFLSKSQRSLYNVNRLKGQPWWTKEETTYQDFFKKLEDNWREIRREGLELFHSTGVNLFKEETENLKERGDWKQLDLYFRGKKQASCNKAPITCSIVSSFKPASTCTRGQIKFSVMLPNTHVWPHCGPTNCRLRSHLGLVVPKKTFIRVAEETRSWEEGKVIIFDDSFEHEVWHNGTGLRLVLIVDIWHPELTNHERRYLSPI